jgi:hypothetical protein
MGRDTRYIVTNLEGGRGKHLYEKIYSARGQAENHIKGCKALRPRSWRHGSRRGRAVPGPWCCPSCR